MSRLASFLVYLALIFMAAGTSAFSALNYSTQTRGTEPPPPAQRQILGTNTALQVYPGDAGLQNAIGLVRSAGLTSIRQHFPWRDIEPSRDKFVWSRWDRIVDESNAAGLQIVAVLDTAPAWAQRQDERDLANAPPENPADYANFAAAFAQRYSSAITYFQIWDEPNVHPSWGRRNADPVAYGQMLHLAAAAIRANAPNAKILLAGLGMNMETQRPHPDYSEVLFLRGLYDAGAQNDFDIAAAKPYGMWTGPEDRRVSPDVLNFSRVVLLREEMKQHGDANKPIWAVEMGWNSLPGNWTGPPSPWGSDTEALQADRLTRALARARAEWGWMGALFPQALQVVAPPNDPRWGFALLSPDGQPRAFYTSLATFSSSPATGAASLPTPPWLPIALLCAVVLVAGWRAVRILPATPLPAAWSALESRFISLPEVAQLAVLAFAVAAFYLSPSVPLNFILLALLVPIFALRLDLGLALLVFSIPFFLYPKTLFGGFELSLVEVLTLVSIGAWLWNTLLTNFHPLGVGDGKGVRGIRRVGMASPPPPSRTDPPLSPRGRGARGEGPHRAMTSLDLAVLAFVLLGIISTRAASNFGVASREFRVIVIEPALLYALLRLSKLTRAQVWRLVNALLLAGVVVCLFGLWQFAAGDVIIGEGVRRVRSVWGSPNNAALFLGRLLPIALAFALFLPEARNKRAYAVIVFLLALTLFLTYSLGALVLGVPASIALLALVWLWPSRHRLRPVHAAVLAALLIGGVAVALLAGGSRLQSLFQTGTGTGFFRVAVWTSATNMIRDHPILGVGLDNFLYEYPKYILPEAWREPNLSHPHNVLLDFWLRLGILGPVVLIWIQVEFFRRIWRTLGSGQGPWARALAVGLAASMVDFLAHGMVDAAYFVVDLAFVFMFTLGVAVSISETEKGRLL